jgi:RNA polymerase sigma factor (sigma-70 family)
MQHYSQLITNFQNGDERAFELLYDNYSGAIYNVILRMTRNEALSQDLLQETFMSIWDKRHQFDSEKGRFYTWAFRIARHKVLNFSRSQKNLIQRDELGVYVDETDNEDLSEELDGLKGAILKLQSHHQRALELVYFNGLTHKEAHKTMDVPLGTFKSYVQQAVRELRKHYNKLSLLLCLYLMP